MPDIGNLLLDIKIIADPRMADYILARRGVIEFEGCQQREEQSAAPWSR